MTVYRVEVDGDVVHEVTTDEYEGLEPFGEWLARPADTPDDEAHLTPVHLYVDDVLVGIQRAHGDEAEQLDLAAEWYDATGETANAAYARADAHAARAHAADALGDPVGGAQHLVNRMTELRDLAETDPDLAAEILKARS